jgi:signal transduction histidine kinase
MQRLRVLHSGAFRLALLFAAVFAVGATTLVAAVNVAVSRYASDTTATALIDESTLLRGEALARGRDALGQLILRRQRIVHAHQFLYLLLDPQGRVVAGELPVASARVGWGGISVAEPAESNEPPDGQSTVRTYGVGLADGSRLIVGRNTSDLDELSDWLRLVTLWSGLGITILAVGGGSLIASIFLRRLDGVNRTLQQIMGGRLEERVAAIGMGDEFDRLTGNLNLMLDRTQALMDGLRQVSTDIAHDLRTPLSRLRQHLESMRSLPRPEDLEGSIDDALAQVDDVLTTFHALLRIGQIEAGAGRARFEPVDLSAVMERVRLAYETAAEDGGKTLSAQIMPSVMVDGDPQLLTQLFANLLENALRHAGESAHISMKLTLVGGAASAVVADDGPGVPAEEQDRVLRRFYRLDASRSTPGSGLGLALVVAIADLHDAQLSLSNNDPGLVVEVRFAGRPKISGADNVNADRTSQLAERR